MTWRRDPAARVIFWEWHLPSGSMIWTGGVEQLFATRESEFVRSRTDWDWRIHPADRPAVAAAVNKLAGGASSQVDLGYRIEGRDGNRTQVFDRWFALPNAQGRPDTLAGTLYLGAAPATPETDEALLINGNHRGIEDFAALADSLPLPTWEADADGWTHFCNRCWYEYSGTSFEQMKGWGWIAVHDPADLSRMLRVFRTAMTTGEPWQDEFRLRRADGMMRWHLARAVPIRDAEGRIIRWFGTNTDIHDQKTAAIEREALLQAEQQLRQAAETANQEKDEFLAVVSHELRNPLNAVLGWAQLLKGHTLDEATRTRAGQKIERNAQGLARMIGELLDASRIISRTLQIERAPVDLAVTLQETLDAARPAADDKRINLVYRAPRHPALVLGEARRLQQVFGNLLTNAIKFSPASRHVMITFEADDALATISIKDEGEGIDPDFMPRLFDRFSQADSSTTRRHGGLGLGLYTARYLVGAHGGTLEAHSEGNGLGSVFTVQLPLIDPEGNEAQLPNSADENADSLIGVSVLVVDDDPEACEVVSSALLSCGGTVTTVNSAAEAFDALRYCVPDVIVSDISMPHVDGYGFIDLLRLADDAVRRSMPVIALTALASEQGRAEALARGFSAYITKPVNIVTLCRTVGTLVRPRLADSDPAV